MNETRRQAMRENRMSDATVPRLWRSKTNKVVAGVVGGVAERLDVNATMLRIIAAMGILLTGVLPGVVLYVVYWAITSRHDVGQAGFSRRD
jgi:phage shock protein C